MGKRRHEEVDALEEEDVAAVPTSNGEKKKKKRKKDKHDLNNDSAELQRSSTKKEKKERSSGKKERKDKKENKDNKEKKERSDRKRRKSQAKDDPPSDLDAHPGTTEAVDVNGADETPSTPSEKTSKKNKKKERSSHKKEKKDKKSSGKKRRRKSGANDDDQDEGGEKRHVNGDAIDLTQSDQKDSVLDVDELDERQAKRRSKKTRGSADIPDSDNMEIDTPAALSDLPTVAQILQKATNKRNAFLHGHAAVPLLSSDVLQALDEKTQGSMIGASADLCERIMHLIHDTITTAKLWTNPDAKDDAAAMEESVVNDMVRLKKVPLAKQYVEMTLWRRVAQLNRDHLLAASRIGFGKGFSETDTRVQGNQGLLLHRENDPDAEFVSYREAYMKDVVEKYSDSLEKMREAESMDADRVQFLLRCLDSGASLFGNLKCLEKKEVHNNNSPN